MEKWYPNNLMVSSKGSLETINFLQSSYEKTKIFNYAELGIYQGSTAAFVASYFPNSKIHLFDYSETISKVAVNLKDYDHKISYYSNSNKYCDSYNWNLLKIIEENKIKFDYIYIDGPHTFAIDGLAYFLSDLLLNPGGFLDFDDYNWTLAGSSLDPSNVKETGFCYTDEQIRSPQVKMLIDNIIRKNHRYEEVVQNRIFKKI